MKLTQEQYNALRAKNLDDNTIKTIAQQKGYELPDGKDFIQKASDFVSKIFPGKQVGESIGTLAGYGVTKVKDLLQGTKVAEGYNLSAPSPLQIAGDIAKGASFVAGLKIPASPTILGKVAQFGTLGAVMGGGESATKKNEATKIAKDAFVSGLTGAAVGGVVGIIGKGISKLTEKTPEALYNNALKVSQRIKTAGKSPVEFLKDENVWGGLGSIQKAAQEGQAQESQAIASKIANRIANKGDVITNYGDIKQKAVEKLSKSIGDLYSQAEIEQLVDSVPIAKLRDTTEGLGLIDTNVVRSQLGQLLGDIKWTQQNPAQTTKAVKAVYGVLADTVQSNTDTAMEFARSSKWLETMKITKMAIQKADAKYGIGLYDLVSGGGGAIIGGLTGEGSVGERLKRAVIGGTIGLGAERLATSPALKTGFAQIISNISKIPTDSAGKISKTAVMGLISKLISTEKTNGKPNESK